MKYKTICEANLTDFNKECNKLISSGYIPIGNFQMIVLNDQLWYGQQYACKKEEKIVN